MASLIFGILRAKTYVIALILFLIGLWARKLGKVDAKVAYAAGSAFRRLMLISVVMKRR